MGWTNDLLDGLARSANTAGLGTYPYTAGMTLPTGGAGIILKNLPDTPDRVVVLTAYNPVDSPDQPLSSLSVQFRFRGLASDVRDVDDLADAWFDHFQGLTYLPCGSVELQQMLRRSAIDGGQDDSRRWERTDNYSIDAWLTPTPHRT